MPSLRLSEPFWLILLALCIPTLWLGAHWLLGMSAARRVTVIASRTLLLALLSLALAGASSPRQTDALAVVVVLDVSDSVRANAPTLTDALGEPIEFEDRVRQMLAAAAGSRESDDRLGLVLFDGVAAAAAMPTRADPTDRSLDVHYAEGSDLGQALRLAAAMLPADASGRLLLISDGNQTAGDALAAANSLVRADGSAVPVDVVPVKYRIEREVLVERVDVPPNAISESTITVRIVLRSTAPATGRLSLLYDSLPVDLTPNSPGTSRPLRLATGQRIETAEVRLDPRRVHRFEAVWEPTLSKPTPTQHAAPLADTSLKNNRARAFTVTPGTGSVLVVQSSLATTTLVRTLRDAKISVDIADPASAPIDVLGWQGHDLVILDDVAADALDERSQHALVAAVTELGTGLVMVGGYNSFGAGGWQGSPIEPILPVKLNVPDRLVMPRVALVLVLDSSGSMGQSVLGSARTQQQIANQAAARAVSSLGPTDLVGVIRFSNSSTTVVPLAPNDQPEATAQRILSIRHGGGTNLLPALKDARQILNDADADLKHVVVLSDGRSQNEDQLAPLAKRMARDGITVTTISVGDQADTNTLRSVAAQGEGSFYEVIDPNRLPAVFLSAVRVVRSPMIREGEFEPVRTAASPLSDALPSPLPTLTGLVLTTQRDDPGITTALTTPDEMPVLAHWQTGLGRVAAFTSDASLWAQHWIDSTAYRTFWVRVVRTLSRPSDDRRFILRSQIQGDAIRFSVEAYQPDGSPTDGLQIPASIYTPSGDQLSVRLTQTAPGLYETVVPATISGDYVAIARPTDGTIALPAAVGGISIPAGAEHRSLASNESLLAEIAERTGGHVLSPSLADAQSLFTATDRPTRKAWIPLWQPLLTAALIVLMLDIATRRVAWDRWLSREFNDEFRQQTLAATADRSASAQRAASALRTRSTPRVSAHVEQPSQNDADALRLVREAQQARQAQQSAASRPTTTSESSASNAVPSPKTNANTPPVDPPKSSEDQNDNQSSASGLLAAKRRAKKRFEDDRN